jgi:hypothetical protein
MDKKAKSIIWLLALGILLYLVQFQAANAAAQILENQWKPAVNLSKAGLSGSPVIIVDENGNTHGFWFDEVAGNRYAYSDDGENWSRPVTVALPFFDILPRLLAGPDNLIYAFWIDEDSQLRLSRIDGESMQKSGAWSTPQVIAQNVTSYDLLLDEEDIFHLTYITNAESAEKPAGVYYVESTPAGGGWNKYQQIYTSLYFRTITARNIPNLSLAVVRHSEEPDTSPYTVYVVWDEPALKRILLSSSSDSGETWEPYQIIDQVDVTSGTLPPSGAVITSWRNELMLMWKKGTPGTNCTLNFRTNSGSGAEWSSPRTLPSSSNSCPSQMDFIGANTEMLFWQAVINGHVYLSAWNGQHWSVLRPQTDLNGIKDPETFTALITGCHQLVFRPDLNQIEALFCDLNGNQDIWFTSMKLGALKTWFPPPSIWTMPENISTSSNQQRELNVVTSKDGSFYALWIESEPARNATSDGGRKFEAVMIASWNGENWNQPTSVVRLEGTAHELSATINNDDEVIIVWNGVNQRRIGVRRAPADRAFTSLAWSEVTEISSPAGTAINPMILPGEGEDMFLVYVVPFNEGRGVYFHRSADYGRTWGDPVQIFNGQDFGWEMVQQPTLTRTSDGRIHALWKHGSFTQGDNGYGLGYAYSTDNGETWSNPNQVTEQAVRWTGIAGDASGLLLRVWQNEKDNLLLMNAQVSTDSGDSWQPTVSIAATADVMGYPSLVSDSAGRIHLLQMMRDQSGRSILLHWIWNEKAWVPGEHLQIILESNQRIHTVTSSISTNKQIAIFYGHDTVSSEIPQQRAVIGIVGQLKGADDILPAPVLGENDGVDEAVNVLSPTPTSVEDDAVEEEVLAVIITSTPNLMDGSVYDGPVEVNRWAGAIYGSLIAILLVGAVFGLRLFQTRVR